MNISKSLVNAFEETKKDKCPFQFQKVYIEKEVRFPTFKAAMHGFFFEYLSTGQKHSDGMHVPKIKAKKEFPFDKFERVHTIEMRIEQWLFETLDSLYAEEVVLVSQTENFHQFLHLYDIKIHEVSPKLIFPIKKDSEDFLKSIPDLLISNFHEPEFEGQKAFLDMKATSLIHDKWSEFGWGGTINDLKKKDSHMNQVKTTLCAHYLLTGEIIPFYFYVASYKNKNDAKLFKVVMNEESIKRAIFIFQEYYDEIIYLHQTGYFFQNAKPDIMNCNDCPYKNKCVKALYVPSVKTLSIL